MKATMNRLRELRAYGNSAERAIQISDFFEDDDDDLSDEPVIVDPIALCRPTKRAKTKTPDGSTNHKNGSSRVFKQHFQVRIDARRKASMISLQTAEPDSVISIGSSTTASTDEAQEDADEVVESDVARLPEQPQRKTWYEELKELQPEVPEGDFDPSEYQTNEIKRDLYTLEEFEELCNLFEEDTQAEIQCIEQTDSIRSANRNLKDHDTQSQKSAQYGRILFGPTDKLLKEILEVKPDEIFIDIGHGIGNTPCQAAYTIGCESRGIELVQDRYDISIACMSSLELARQKLHEQRDDHIAPVGEIKLVKGRLEDPQHREFLTAPGKIVKAFANNFNGVFSDRSAKLKAQFVLDDYIAGLFASFAPGSKLVTLHPLNLGASLSEANKARENHGFRTDSKASFFELETREIGKQNQVASWSANGSCEKMVTVYVYTRVAQGTFNEEPQFYCTNRNCTNAKRGVLMNALVKKNLETGEGDRTELRYVVSTDCRLCNHGTHTTGRRNRRTVS